MRDASQADLNLAKADEAGSKAKKHRSESDRLDQDYLQEADGTKHMREMQKQDQKDSNAIAKEIVKTKAKTPEGEN